MKKNYQLDFIKLIFSFVIVIGHTLDFYKDDTVFFMDKLTIGHFGKLGVHVFFVISGLLMTNSIVNRAYDPAESGKQALNYVWKKGKNLFLPCFVAATISAATFIILMNRAKVCYAYVPSYFLELFFVRGTGIVSETMFNGVTWYISSMLIAMLPLCYLLIKNKDLYIHIIAPLTGFLLLGYMYQTGENHMPLDQDVMYGVLLGGVIRALCGLTLGSVSWLICQKLKECDLNKKKKIFLTIGELMGFALFFGLMLSNWTYSPNRKESMYFILILMSILLAVVFSGQSYISHIFEKPVFKYCGSLSLIIYLNQMNARFIVKTYFIDNSYYKCVLLMLGFTAVNSLLYFAVLKLLEFLGKKVKTVLE